jgi:iron complex outermembrane receptor protein
MGTRIYRRPEKASSNRPTKKSSLTGAATLAAALAIFSDGALAQDVPLPQINVTDTRLTGIGSPGRGGSAAPALRGTSSGTAPADSIGNANVPDNGGGITGASTTIITRQDIERAPEATIADILSREAGIQTSNFYGGVNGVGTTVDMRGFGVTGASNTLILINGRRLNDWDLPGFDLTTLGKNSVERIEVTRGNSGSVLYGDGAVGGVINIVTRNGVGQPSQARIEAGYGSYATREGNVSANLSSGAFSTSIYANGLDSTGYRWNNSLFQRNAVGDLRWTTDKWSAYFNIGTDDQKMRLPGERQIDVAAGKDEYNQDRRGTNTPLNYANKQGERYTAGATAMLAPGFEVIVDGGIRKKFQQAGFFQAFGQQYVGTELTTSSFTPRVNINQNWWGIPVKAIAGVDLYRTDYDSDRSLFIGLTPIHQFDGQQKSLAGYGMVTLALLPTTDVSIGGRIQRTQTRIGDVYDPFAPQNFSFPQGGPLDEAQTNRSWHLGFEHRFNDNFAIFGRAATSFRVPNVDERIGNGAIVFPLPPPTFALNTQTSEDFEGGIKLRFGKFLLQSSVYRMNLQNELHLSPITFANINLDPTRRTGVETLMTWSVTDWLRLKGNVTYQEALYREGPFAGNFVPVVSRWTGNAGVSMDVWQKYLTLDAVMRYASDRFLDNDEFNRGTMKIPSHAVFDVRIAGAYDKFFWSFAVQNLFDRKYFDYGLDASFSFLGTTFNIFNLYPLPGRTFMLKAGMQF